MIRGLVTDFDAARGDGCLRSDEGTTFYFHCVTIADGTRVIPLDARVSATRSVGHLGRDEATNVAVIEEPLC
jgi:cold shock CspA family protein